MALQSIDRLQVVDVHGKMTLWLIVLPHSTTIPPVQDGLISHFRMYSRRLSSHQL